MSVVRSIKQHHARGGRQTLEAVSWTAGREDPMRKFIDRFIADESGATAIEYGLIAALLAVVIIGALQALGGNLKTKFTSVSTARQLEFQFRVPASSGRDGRARKARPFSYARAARCCSCANVEGRSGDIAGRSVAACEPSLRVVVIWRQEYIEHVRRNPL